MVARPVITREQLTAIMPRADANAFLYPLNAAMKQFEINDKVRMAMFLANVAHESSELTRLRENMNYSAEQLMEVFSKYFTTANVDKYARQPEKIANRVYADRGGNGDEKSGDGWDYRGGGGLGLTFRSNYRRAGEALGVDLESNPEKITEPKHACDTAAWYWRLHGCNEYADHGMFDMTVKAINRARLGLTDRRAHFARAFAVLSP